MRKLTFISLFILLATMVSAQTIKGEQSLMVNGGFQTNHKRIMLGSQYRYLITDNFRLAPDIMFFFPKNRTTGLDVNINLHYAFKLENTGFEVYPLIGYAMQNNRYMGETKHGIKTKSRGWTDSGFNLGAGTSYSLSSKTFLNGEIKYVFGDQDCFLIHIGYGLRF